MQKSETQGQPSTSLLSIGRATTAALIACGLHVDKLITRNTPSSRQESADCSNSPQENSEALLESVNLTDVMGKKVVVLSGLGGRSVLVDSLKERGAEVIPVRVYRRTVLPWLNQKTELRSANAVVLSSGEAVNAFHREWKKRKASLHVPLIVPNERVKGIAQRIGFERVYASGGAGDDAVIRSLMKVLNDRDK